MTLKQYREKWDYNNSAALASSELRADRSEEMQSNPRGGAGRRWQSGAKSSFRPTTQWRLNQIGKTHGVARPRTGQGYTHDHKIALARRNGAQLGDIAREFGLDIKSVSWRLVRLGFPVGRSGLFVHGEPFSKQTIAAFCRNTGITQKDISVYLGRSPNWMSSTGSRDTRKPLPARAAREVVDFIRSLKIGIRCDLDQFTEKRLALIQTVRDLKKELKSERTGSDDILAFVCGRVRLETARHPEFFGSSIFDRRWRTFLFWWTEIQQRCAQAGHFLKEPSAVHWCDRFLAAEYDALHSSIADAAKNGIQAMEARIFRKGVLAEVKPAARKRRDWRRALRKRGRQKGIHMEQTLRYASQLAKLQVDSPKMSKRAMFKIVFSTDFEEPQTYGFVWIKRNKGLLTHAVTKYRASKQMPATRLTIIK
jgi:hypothetical protein